MQSVRSNRYRSTTNIVLSTCWRGYAAICKDYQAQTTENLLYPLMRSELEAKALTWLEGLVGFETLVPRLLQWDPSMHRCIMSIVPGEPLRDLSLEQWPPPGSFEVLGRSLAQVEQESLSAGFRLPEGLQLVGTACGEFISRYKGIPLRLDGSITCLSLGDVATQNILSDGFFISLVDFEFAHLGSVGKDAGVLCGELMAYETVHGLPRDFRDKLLSGYESRGGNGCYSEKWSELALPYHIDKQTRLSRQST